MDCPDLSDECLCQEPATHQISRLCDRLCLTEVWSFNGRIRPHCASCMPGNIFDELTESKGKNSTNTASSLCLETFHICQENRNEQIDRNLENVCISADKIKARIVLLIVTVSYLKNWCARLALKSKLFKDYLIDFVDAYYVAMTPSIVLCRRKRNLSNASA